MLEYQPSLHTKPQNYLPKKQFSPTWKYICTLKKKGNLIHKLDKKNKSHLNLKQILWRSDQTQLTNWSEQGSQHHRNLRVILSLQENLLYPIVKQLPQEVLLLPTNLILNLKIRDAHLLEKQ